VPAITGSWISLSELIYVPDLPVHCSPIPIHLISSHRLDPTFGSEFSALPPSSRTNPRRESLHALPYQLTYPRLKLPVTAQRNNPWRLPSFSPPLAMFPKLSHPPRATTKPIPGVHWDSRIISHGLYTPNRASEVTGVDGPVSGLGEHSAKESRRWLILKCTSSRAVGFAYWYSRYEILAIFPTTIGITCFFLITT